MGEGEGGEESRGEDHGGEEGGGVVYLKLHHLSLDLLDKDTSSLWKSEE